MSNETDALDLANIVKSNDSDETIWVCLHSLSKLLQHLSRVCATKHGQLPHGPVASIIVSWGPVVLTVHKPFLYNTHTHTHRSNQDSILTWSSKVSE